MSRPSVLEKLMKYFQELPGIGPRQAERFAYALIDKDERVVEGFARSLMDLMKQVTRCKVCGRAIMQGEGVCEHCRGERSLSPLLTVEKDQDLDAILRSGVHGGAFHVLGGLMLTGKETRVRDQIAKLHERVRSAAGTQKDAIEIVLAFAATPEGDTTAAYIEKVLEEFLNTKKVRVSRLGRGLSTGTELEYADTQTIKYAFESRNEKKKYHNNQ